MIKMKKLKMKTKMMMNKKLKSYNILFYINLLFMILPIYIIVTTLCYHYQYWINALTINHIAIWAFCWYVLNVLTYYILDILHPEYLSKYITKQKNNNEKMSYNYMLLVSTINFSIVILLFVMTVTYFNRGCQTNHIFLPVLFFELIMYVTCYETAFYCLHMLIHRPQLYWIHKLHHQTFGTVAISCFCMSIQDMFLEIFIPVILGPFLYDGHTITLLIWITLAIFNTFKEHSGYGRLYHYYHHTTQNKNYGLVFLDSIFKTEY